VPPIRSHVTCFIAPDSATRVLRNLFARRGPMAEKQNQGIQKEKCVDQCFASFALFAGWGHGRVGLLGSVASSIA
jgi:hypothetical protein